MSNEAEAGLSQDLEQFILLALGMGLDNLKKQGSLIPMVLSRQGDEIALSIIDEPADEVMDAAAKYVADLPPEANSYALLFDGKMNVEGEMLSAVIVQAGERGEEHGHTVYQQYDPGAYEAVGPPEYAGQAAQLLAR